MDMGDVPHGFLWFFSDFEFAQACSYCADFNLDVLDLFINGFNCLVFFSLPKFNACVFYCNLNNFNIFKYVLMVN